MLDSFREMASSSSSGSKHLEIDWRFLEVHAEGEEEHAAIGRDAVCSLVEDRDVWLVRKAMYSHDHDFANFYDGLTNILLHA